MGWATTYIDKLKNGQTVQFRPHGGSMTGKIESGQLCTVRPVADDEDIEPGDIVLCKVKYHYLHLVKAVQVGRYQIGNNKGHVNGWVGRNCIYGKLIKVET